MAEQAAQYKCDICGATFRDADALTKHKLVHEGEAKPEKEDLEQGTQPPTQNPTITNPGGPGPALSRPTG